MGEGARPGYPDGAGKKLTEAVQWQYGKKREYCETCRQAADQRGEDPGCLGCPFDRYLIPENEQLWECFQLCSSQLLVGNGCAYAMNWEVVARVAGTMGIKVDHAFYYLLRAFEGTMISELQNKGDKPDGG
jgi:hypothetical protein